MFLHVDNDILTSEDKFKFNININFDELLKIVAIETTKPRMRVQNVFAMWSRLSHL